MGTTTKIEWCDHTFNPWIGCTKISAGCTNCYAADIAKRFYPGTWGPQGRRTVAPASRWNEVHNWNTAGIKNRTHPLVFCGSMCDIFEDNLDLGLLEARAELFRTIVRTKTLIWLLLTKRPENITRFIPGGRDNPLGFTDTRDWLTFPPGNVMYLTSVEDQATAAKRIGDLVRVPAHMLGLSVEPLLERTNLGFLRSMAEVNDQNDPGRFFADLIDWVIVGGESGPKARHCETLDIFNIIEQCQEFRCPVFVKQMGSKPFHSLTSEPLTLKDRKGGNPEEWPLSFRRREFPRQFCRRNP